MIQKENKAYWRDIISRYKSSNQAQHKFCDSENIGYKQFKYYYYKFKNDSAKHKSTITQPLSQVSLKVSPHKSHLHTDLSCC